MPEKSNIYPFADLKDRKKRTAIYFHAVNNNIHVLVFSQRLLHTAYVKQEQRVLRRNNFDFFNFVYKCLQTSYDLLLSMVSLPTPVGTSSM